MTSYAEEYKKRHHPKMQDRDAYIAALEDKVKMMSNVVAENNTLNDRITEINQQVSSLDGKVVHLTKLHRLGQSLIDSQDEEYNKDKQMMFQKIEKLETALVELSTNFEKKTKDFFQEGVIERLDNETKWLKKQMQTKHAALADMLNKEITDIASRDKQSLQKLEDLADIVQHEVRRRETEEGEILDSIKLVRDNTRKVEEQLALQEGRLTAKIKHTEEHTRADLNDTLRQLAELHVKCDGIDQATRAGDRERHVMQEQVQKMTITISETYQPIHSLQRDAEEMMRETKRDRGRLEDALVLFKEEAQESKREQLHLAEDLMARVQDSLRRQQKEQVDTKDIAKVERELERIFEELDQLNMKQKIFDKTLSQKLESFEQVQSRFVREVSQKVEENAKQNKQELGEAAKIEKRTALRVEDCLEQVNGLSGQVRDFIQFQQPLQSKTSSPDAGKITSVERKMKETIYKMYEDMRTKNESFHQESRELLRKYDSRIAECMERINILVEMNTKTRMEVQQKMDQCVKVVNSFQSDASSPKMIRENTKNEATSPRLTRMTATNKNRENKAKPGGEDEASADEIATNTSSPNTMDDNNDNTNKQNVENTKDPNKIRDTRATDFNARWLDSFTQRDGDNAEQRLKSAFDARLAFSEELRTKTNTANSLDRSWRKILKGDKQTEKREPSPEPAPSGGRDGLDKSWRRMLKEDDKRTPEERRESPPKKIPPQPPRSPPLPPRTSSLSARTSPLPLKTSPPPRSPRVTKSIDRLDRAIQKIMKDHKTQEGQRKVEKGETRRHSSQPKAFSPPPKLFPSRPKSANLQPTNLQAANFQMNKVTTTNNSARVQKNKARPPSLRLSSPTRHSRPHLDDFAVPPPLSSLGISSPPTPPTHHLYKQKLKTPINKKLNPHLRFY